MEQIIFQLCPIFPSLQCILRKATWPRVASNTISCLEPKHDTCLLCDYHLLQSKYPFTYERRCSSSDPYVTHTGCCFVTFACKTDALVVQSRLHNQRTIPGVSILFLSMLLREHTFYACHSLLSFGTLYRFVILFVCIMSSL